MLSEKLTTVLWHHQKYYNHFTRAVSNLKKKEDDSETNKTMSGSSALKMDYELLSPHLIKETDSVERFLLSCILCKKVGLRSNGKKHYAIKFTLDTATKYYKSCYCLVQ